MVELITPTEDNAKSVFMTLLESMADYQTPPVITDPSMKNNERFERLKKRLKLYQNRHKESLVNDRNVVQTKYEASQEQTLIYHEKWQQQKAKKSNKRQRDSNNTQPSQLKRKLSTTKSDGAPPTKQQNLEKSGDNDVNDSEELKSLFDGLDLPVPEHFTENNLKDIMTMLEESESSNASQQDCIDKDHMLSNNMYAARPTTNQQAINNSRPTSTPQQTAHRIKSSPSPQLPNGVTPSSQGLPHQQQCQSVGSYSVRQIPPVHGYTQTIKSEVNPTSQYNRSMSDTVQPISLQHHNPSMPTRQGSLPSEFVGPGFYPTPYSKNAMSSQAPSSSQMVGGGQRVGIPPEYSRQLSTPTMQPNGSVPCYQQQPGQVPVGHGMPADYPPGNRHIQMTSYPQGYPRPTTQQYNPLHHHPQTQQQLPTDMRPDMQRHFEQQRFSSMQPKPSLNRTNSMPPYVDPRVPPTSSYYPIGQEHMSSLQQPGFHPNQIPAPQPTSGRMASNPSPYLQNRSGYMHHHTAQSLPPTGALPQAGTPGVVMPRQMAPHPTSGAVMPHDMHSTRTTVPTKVSHMPQQLPGNAIPRTHPANLPTSQTAPPNISPYHTSAHPQLMRQNSALAASQSAMAQANRQMSRPPSNTSVQPQIVSNHASMHQQSMQRPPSAGGHPHSQLHPLSPTQAQHPHLHHQQNSYTMQQQQQLQQRQQQQQSLPSVPKHISVQQHMSQVSGGHHPQQRQTQQQPPSQESQVSQLQQQQQQINSFMASSAEDLSDLEMILSGT